MRYQHLQEVNGKLIEAKTVLGGQLSGSVVHNTCSAFRKQKTSPLKELVRGAGSGTCEMLLSDIHA